MKKIEIPKDLEIKLMEELDSLKRKRQEKARKEQEELIKWLSIPFGPADGSGSWEH